MSDPALTPRPLPVEPQLEVPITVYYFDTDAAGVVNNIAYLRMIEVARTHLAEHLGWTLAEMDRTGFVPVVARTEIDYLRPARLRSRPIIRARLAGLERIRFFLEFVVFEATDPALVYARCRQTMVGIQLPSGRPQRVPAAWQAAYGQLLKKSPEILKS